MKYKTSLFLCVLFVVNFMMAQNNFEAEKEIVNQELSYVTAKKDSVFLNNRFNNRLLYGWFNAKKEKFDFGFATEKTKKVLFEMALLNDSVKEVPGDRLINSGYVNNNKVYFIDYNNRNIKRCKKTGGVQVQVEALL